jgi:hypothetical protein
VKTIKEIYIKGTEPTRKDNLHVEAQIDAATGLLWQDGCTGPMVTKTFLDFSQAEERFPQWQPYTQEWAQRAARGPGVAGGPKHTRTSYFYNSSFHPFGRPGAARSSRRTCARRSSTARPGGPPSPQPSDAVPVHPDADAGALERQPAPDAERAPAHEAGGPKPTATPLAPADARRPVGTRRPGRSLALMFPIARVPDPAPGPALPPEAAVRAKGRASPARRPSPRRRPRRAPLP